RPPPPRPPPPPIDPIPDFIRPKRTQSMPILQQGDLVSTAGWIDADRCPRCATVNPVLHESFPRAFPSHCHSDRREESAVPRRHHDSTHSYVIVSNANRCPAQRGVSRWSTISISAR